MTVVSGSIIFVLYRLFIATVDGAKQRLEREADAARAKSAELNRKVAEVDEELKKRRAELNVIEKKIKGELEAEANKQKDDLIQKARTEAEEIITRAQSTRDNIRREVEKTMELKIIDYALRVLKEILSHKGQGEFNKQLVGEFIEKIFSTLKKMTFY